ncbi:MAG: glycosyltransferase family 2 protein [Verrucomicrobiales bacterium]|nr:glycosyltransferase family 2 protein [Verrucomicrobiales bacterium]MCP5560745.1 glycosyltransferase family 2 protein [Verrucomicrobiaceae bacterium]
MTDFLTTTTPVILTYNEEPNIARCLERLHWARHVIIVDSFSTDATQKICEGYANVTFLQRAFDDHTQQWNFGVQATSTPWVLALDADYVLGTGFEDELAALNAPDDVDAYDADFRYLICGKPLRACLYPPRAVLFRKDRCHYIQDGHTQLLHVPRKCAHLTTPIDHDDRKSLTRWFASQDKYALLEADKLTAADSSTLRPQDKLRRTMFAAIPATLIYTLIVKGTILDGWRGWYYTLQRTIAEVMLTLRLLEKKFSKDAEP